ncbi:polysaccharide pyruvyl transferase family protein [Kribbella sp. NPDC026611]|uniref:polysaccharide pyruvyl transferase family protein n=1 Tax=Kribbella sp. NPDC026611 TaxID=3154911 RepID=UPI0033DD1ADA
MRTQRVGLFGRLGAGNLGNDASMETILGFLATTAPEATVDALCSGPARLTEHYGLPAGQLLWMHAPMTSRLRLARPVITLAKIGLGAVIDTCRIAAWVRRHDVVIVPGMGVLESNLPQRPWQLPYALFVLSVAGRLFRTKIALVGVGASVVEEGLTRKLLVTAGRLASFRSFRDQDSLGAAQQIGLADPADKVCPDLAFALPVPPDLPGATDAVGVGVMAYYGGPEDRHQADRVHTEYVTKMTAFVRRLIESGRPVRLLIGDADDEAVALGIRAAVRAGAGADVPISYDRPETADDVMRQLATVDAVVGTRFHTVLLAVKLAKPTIAIAYGQKHAALMAAMGAGDLVQNVKDLDVDVLAKQLETALSDRDSLIPALAERSDENARRLDDHLTELAAALF